MRLSLVIAVLASSESTSSHVSSHLRWLTFYGFGPKITHGFQNLVSGDGATLDEMVAAHAKWGMSAMPQLPSDIFNRSGHSLHPAWETHTKTFVSTLQAHINSGVVVGVFMGDEICCSGVPLSNLSAVATKLRTLLGPSPSPFIYTNECAIMSSWPAVPSAIDYISIDFYDEHNTDGQAEVAKNIDYYTKTIFPKLAPHQRVMLVPGIFASDPAHCIAGNVSCPLAKQAEQVVIKLEGMLEWAKNDSRIVGFNPWHFNNRSSPQLKGWWDQRLGAASMPTVVDKLREIGEFIKNSQSDGYLASY